MAGYAGIRTYFNLGSAAVPSVPTDISRWLDGVTPGSDTDELDGTTFQPGVASPVKEIVAGFTTRSMSLSVKWNEAAELFFSSVDKKTGLPYAYGPLGKDAGMVGIGGLCNVLSWTGPVSTVDGVITGTLEIRATSRDVGAFDATGALAPVVAATGATAGTPGTFTPAGAVKPANIGAMGAITAQPATAWTTGQHVVLGDATKAYWNATAWVAGQAP
jgi:hypothetical protein